MMTKQNFERLAQVLKDHVEFSAHGIRVVPVQALIDWCASENPNFDRGRFLKACQ